MRGNALGNLGGCGDSIHRFISYVQIPFSVHPHGHDIISFSHPFYYFSGSVYLAMGDTKRAFECFQAHISLLLKTNSKNKEHSLEGS